ncbi:MAG TPA: hypothetical protein P5060_01795 [Candidatus Absconditabacterales bacterium]|nr:hypothetical protein [Candidatus Absconditabacterales bacterium]
MIEQNQENLQANNQVQTGGNPYDLIDNKANEGNVQETQASVQNANNIQVDTNNGQVNQVVQNSGVEEKVYKGPSGFTKKLIKFIAKLSGQPDPETGEIKKSTEKVTTNNQSVGTKTEAPQKKPFDAIMGGVTGFLDKVESKVESVAGIDLDAPINKLNQNNQVPAEQKPQEEVNKEVAGEANNGTDIENTQKIE